MSGYKKGDKVSFGRPGGEQTLGIVEKVNPKSLKVRTFEARGLGRRVAAGEVWRVTPALCTLLERDGQVVPDAGNAAGHFPNTPLRKGAKPGRSPDEDSLVTSALAKLTTAEQYALATYYRRGYIDSSLF